MIFGKNYDWHLELGYTMINPRGLAKTALPCGASGDKPAVWTSRYGSLTFNQYGREFPMGGINEAGLALEVLMLAETEYPVPDSRPVIQNLQWIQYQLDNFRTVEELLAGLAQVRIPPSEAYGLHYLACDKTGQCASIEFLKGRTVVHSKNTLPVPVLTNSPYEKSLAFYRKNGTTASASSGSLARFSRAAGLLRNFNPQKSGALVDYGCSILKSLAMGDHTKWSIIYDLQEKRVYFRTASKPALKYVDLSALDFSCRTQVRALDLNSDANGNTTGLFGEYSRQQNYELIEKALLQTPLPVRVSDESVHYQAAYPETNHCVN